MPRTGNPEGLRISAKQKKNETLERTNKAISQLVKAGKKINFQTVAEAAGVSVAYLYKYDDIKQRIDQLRKQQSSIKALPQKQCASADSHKAITKVLKKRISDLQAEVRGLRNHIEVVEGRAMQVTDLKQQMEGLRAENSKLREQLSNCMASKSASTSAKSKSNVTPLGLKKAVCQTISNQLQSKLDELGIKVNSTLSKLLESAPDEVVLIAIDALKQALATTKVRNRTGFLVEAIRNTWIPNQPDEQKVEIDFFNKWYLLAKSLRLVHAATQFDGVQHVLLDQGEWVSFEVMAADYPLEKLREMATELQVKRV